MGMILLLVIYIAFIGLGIPDSLFGTAWPAIYQELDLPVSWANFVTILISGGTIVSSLLSARALQYLGTAKITAISTTMTAIALLGFSYARSMIWLCLFAVPLGLGAGAIDTALNHYVAVHYKAAHMNFLHCFYGVGVSLSPFLMSIALSTGAWREGYRSVFWFQLGISILTIISLPVWKKVGHVTVQKEDKSATTIGLFGLLRTAKVRSVCMIFIGSCAIEYTCGIWGSTFLVNDRGMAVDGAARTITFYYIGIALGRFLSGVLSAKITNRQFVQIGQGIILLAILMMIFPVFPIFSGIGLFLAGFGNAPIFPNMLYLTPQHFDSASSGAVIGVEMSASYIGIMLAPALFGLIAQNISIVYFPYYLLGMYSIMIIGSIFLDKVSSCVVQKQ